MKTQKSTVGAFLIICTMALIGCGSSNDGLNASSDEATSHNGITYEPIETDGAEEAATTGLSFEVPTGMIEDESMPGYYVSSHYADDYASVFYQESIYDDRYSLLTEDTIAELMQSMYSDTYGIETVIEIKAFNRINFDGYEAYYLAIEYSVDDILIESTEYSIISGDKIYSITYAQKKDSGWDVKFERSVNNLQVIQ